MSPGSDLLGLVDKFSKKDKGAQELSLGGFFFHETAEEECGEISKRCYQSVHSAEQLGFGPKAVADMVNSCNRR